jgi:hypothetical protein
LGHEQTFRTATPCPLYRPKRTSKAHDPEFGLCLQVD